MAPLRSAQGVVIVFRLIQGDTGMSEKRYRPEELIGQLREADVLFSQGKKVVDVIKKK